jgi:RimJ/RimL family protein N-acetyltransferase
MEKPDRLGSSHHVELRDVKQSDLPIFFEHQIDPEASQMAAFPSRDREPYIAHWIMVLEDESIGKKTVLYDGEVAGNIVSFGPENERMVGYWIGRDYWGKGVATLALRQFLQVERTRPLYAHVAKHNIGSIRVLEKCGFTIVGEEQVLDSPDIVIEEFVMKLAATNIDSYSV